MTEKFLLIGTGEIREDKFESVKDVGGAKPYGGLYLTPYVSSEFNPLIDRMLYDRNMRYLWFNTKKSKNPFERSCCAVSLENGNRLYSLHNDQTFDYLMKCFSSIDGSFSYEGLSKFYDGIYMNLSDNLYKI